jgi:hypothetical protein
MTLLADLLDASRRRVRADRRVTPLAELRRQVAAMAPAPRFEAALRRPSRGHRRDQALIAVERFLRLGR